MGKDLSGYPTYMHPALIFADMLAGMPTEDDVSGAADAIEALLNKGGLSHAQLAKLLLGDIVIDEQIASGLEHVTGVPADEWLKRQALIDTYIIQAPIIQTAVQWGVVLVGNSDSRFASHYNIKTLFEDNSAEKEYTMVAFIPRNAEQAQEAIQLPGTRGIVLGTLHGKLAFAMP